MTAPRKSSTLVVLALTTSLAACRGCAGEAEQAFCDAVERNDAAAAKTLFDTGRVNMLSRDFSQTCEPGKALLRRAKPASPEFTALAVAFAGQEGVANACWTSAGNSRSGSSGGMSCALNLAVENGNALVVRALLERGASVSNEPGQRALMDAGNLGDLDVVRALVERGGDPNWALGLAISSRNAAVVEYLESKGAREDQPPLLVAARRGDLAAVEAAIAAKADLNAVDARSRSALYRAALYGHADVVTRLATAGARLDLMTPDDFWTPMHVAANENHADVIRALAAARAKVDGRKDAAYGTPLLVAVRNGSVDAVKALLAAGADPNAFTESDATALYLAAAGGHYAMVKALLDAGARVNEAHGQAWQPPLHLVVGLCGPLPKGDPDNDNYRVAVMKALIAAGADPAPKNAEGKTPLEVATANLAGTQSEFYRACYQAKIDLLRGR